MAETVYKAMYKNELARAAGVSMKTFRKWLFENHAELVKFGYKKTDSMLSPGSVKFLCEKYVIILE
ncbi:MAG TPA: hypothetical protein PK984_04465 [Paludibacteraceae bacterium]|nr:hypothetical protein [Paludibacteraceae bacterium]HOS37450.1 hypothetical protein [Paludibacteraceae bacterium]HPK20344.1 hypothetical protein [Paludibacteraceae bacterium]